MSKVFCEDCVHYCAPNLFARGYRVLFHGCANPEFQSEVVTPIRHGFAMVDCKVWNMFNKCHGFKPTLFSRVKTFFKKRG
jgi:hypothetical protein